MSIQSFSTTEHDDHPTGELEATASGPILDAVPLLDHRTRRRAIPTVRAPRGHYLEFQNGGQQLYVPLDKKITHLGRGFTADVRFEQNHVSVSHAILVRHGRFMRVLDNRSSNGTFINGRRVIATNLNDGDVLRVGPIVMRYVVIS